MNIGIACALVCLSHMCLHAGPIVWWSSTNDPFMQWGHGMQISVVDLQGLKGFTPHCRQSRWSLIVGALVISYHIISYHIILWSYLYFKWTYGMSRAIKTKEKDRTKLHKEDIIWASKTEDSIAKLRIPLQNWGFQYLVFRLAPLRQRFAHNLVSQQFM